MKKIQQGFIYLVLALIVISCNKESEYTFLSESKPVGNPLPSIRLPRVECNPDENLVCFGISKIIQTGFPIDSTYLTVSDYGICYSSTNENPTLEQDGTLAYSLINQGLSISSCTLTNLTKDVKYYLRAYCTTKAGTGYSTLRTAFSNSNIVTFGSADWDLKNLDVTTYNDGTIIPEAKDLGEWRNDSIGKWCYYDFKSENASQGKFYNWYAVMGIHDTAALRDPKIRKSLAPKNYHVATINDWTTLLSTNNFSYFSFRANLNGYIKESGTGDESGAADYWWPASQADAASTPFYKSVSSGTPILTELSTPTKKLGCSVRCIRDK